MTIADVLIIGGGPAGLATATALARQLYRTIVFDSGVYRNAPTSHMHNVLGWDHRDPADFRAKARDDLAARYAGIVEFRRGSKSGRVDSVAFDEGRKLFRAVDAEGQRWWGRKLVLAMGVSDVFPPVEGYGDVWGRGVYQCLFCDGYESRGAPSSGVLAIQDVAQPQVALHLARMALRLSESVTIYTDGNIDVQTQLGDILRSSTTHNDKRIKIDNRTVTRLAKQSPTGQGVQVHLADGSVVEEGFVVHKPRTKINGPFVEQLGVETTDAGVINVTPPFNETSVKGVFAIGDCASMVPAVANAIAMGVYAAGGLTAQLQSENVPELSEENL
ncbi:FAD/NAD(P)-binding domain-protein [Echria macrotheca]|uniref:FAD/NAD(P)-binding domain-protein n=1 Tax=Echria macrotheca TaxID=438768 RepID=A0AAJ0BQQ4_9PEZI|nr:FAD/NAD(P)-binding domain-protein [Echria macrotheca]